MKFVTIVIFLLVCLVKETAPSSVEIDYDKINQFYEDQKKSERMRFFNDLSYRESRHNWKIVNKWGYIGRWQFGEGALRKVGMNDVTVEGFKNNPYIFSPNRQLVAIDRWMNILEVKINPYLKYEGQVLVIKNDTVLITKSGLLAAAHLGGRGNLDKWFKYGYVAKDGLGTTIIDYMNEFSSYNF